MKKYLIVALSFCVLFAFPCFADNLYGADAVAQDGIIYTRYKQGFASCRVNPSDQKKLVQAAISFKVNINGENCIVDKIEDYGFAQCPKLTHITIPTTIRYIGALAFAFDGQLRSISCQSYNFEFGLGDKKWVKGYGPFALCNKLSAVKWATETPPAFINKLFKGNEKCPYMKSLLAGKANTSVPSIANNSTDEKAWQQKESVLDKAPTFSDYAAEHVTKVYNSWQTRKQYESASQYAERTSPVNRERKKHELYENAKNNYINQYAPRYLSGNLVAYDDEYKVFTIDVPQYGNIYAQVPLADRAFVEDNWAGVDIIPTFTIANNELAIINSEYKIAGKTYYAPTLYNDKVDDLSLLEFDAQKMNLDELATTEGKNDPALIKDSQVNIAPTTGINNANTYALIIGNEDYKYVEPVGYALADASTFARYCRNTLGIPAHNILAVQNVTKGELRRTIREMQGFFEDDGANKSLVVYYAGHGIPDVKNADAMILPVDASASDLESCYSMQELYNKLGEFGAKNVVVYLDACFTGSTRKGKQMLASRAGVDFVRAQVEPRGNTIVVSATSADETAQPYDAQGHGIFTYYLLDKLKSSQGNVSLGELVDYVTTKVKANSLHVTGKKQIPSTMVSPTFKGDWRALPTNLLN